jgi:predicted dehydrogenase
MVNRIAIALNGLGPGAEPHANSLIDLAHRVDVKAAASRTERRARAFADCFGFPATTNIDAVIADASIQAAIVLFSTLPNAASVPASMCW